MLIRTISIAFLPDRLVFWVQELIFSANFCSKVVKQSLIK